MQYDFCKMCIILYLGDQSWVFIGRTDVEAETPNTLATWCEELTHLKRPWCWERLRAGGEGDDRGWDGWMASLTQWTWVWLDSGSWWWTGRPGVLRFMGSQRVRHDWVTELNWFFCIYNINSLKEFTLKKGYLIFPEKKDFWLFYCYFSFLEYFYTISFPEISHYLTRYFCISNKQEHGTTY